MKKRIILVGLIFVLVINLVYVSPTFSWFTTTDDLTTGDFLTGKLDYVINGDLIGEENVIMLIVPADELLSENGEISFTNKSTIPSFLKVDISAKLKNELGEITGDALNLLDITFNPGETWTKDLVEDTWYYGLGTGDEIPIVESGQTQTINFIDSLKLDENVSQEHSAKFLEINITFYARQSKNMDWLTLDEIHYQTGFES
jgi:hypothetical protein